MTHQVVFVVSVYEFGYDIQSEEPIYSVECRNKKELEAVINAYPGKRLVYTSPKGVVLSPLICNQFFGIVEAVS